MKRPPFTTVLGLFFLLLAVLAAAGCDRDNNTQSAASQPTATLQPIAIATPSPTQSPAPTVSLGPAHSLELPSDDNGDWFPVDLLQGTTTFVIDYIPEPTTDEKISQGVSRLAFFDAETGKLAEFRTLNPGDQAVSFANDGRYLVWVEGSRGNEGPQSWRIYAFDSNTRDIWTLDSDPEIQLLEGGEPSIAVDQGRLIYFALAQGDKGAAVYQTVSVDLQTRTRAVLSEDGDANSQVLLDPSLSGNTLVWVRTLFTDAPSGTTAQRSLMLLDLPSRETSVLVSDGVTRWPTVRDGKALYATSDSMHLIDLVTGADRVLASTSPWPRSRALVGRFAIWQDMRDMEAMLCDTATGAVMPLSDPQQFTSSVYVSGERVYWVSSPRVDRDSARIHLFLNWTDLPSP